MARSRISDTPQFTMIRSQGGSLETGLKMAEERISIYSNGLTLEGLMAVSWGHKAVVVTHPHPLFGGDMYNNVVEAIVQAYRGKDYTTLRFNFRGVGQSGGTHDQGIGEQDDVQAALAFLHGRGERAIDLAGYSFGAWVNALGVKNFSLAERLIMVSPPVNFADFSSLGAMPKLWLVITGADDDVAPPAMIKERLSTWNSSAVFRVIPGADHFYWGSTPQLKGVIREFLDHDDPIDERRQ